MLWKEAGTLDMKPHDQLEKDNILGASFHSCLEYIIEQKRRKDTKQDNDRPDRGFCTDCRQMEPGTEKGNRADHI